MDQTLTPEELHDARMIEALSAIPGALTTFPNLVWIGRRVYSLGDDRRSLVPLAKVCVWDRNHPDRFTKVV